jgi:hypothetical protein
MLRFVILEHDHPELHWDLMLECGPVLRTWRLAAFPQPGQSISAEASFAHRLLYLDFQGPVSGNRGHVKQCDTGIFDWLTPEPHAEMDDVIVLLEGRRLRGRAILRRTGKGWSFTLENPGDAVPLAQS